MCIDINKIAKLSMLSIIDEDYEELKKKMEAVMEMFKGLPEFENNLSTESYREMELREDKVEEVKIPKDKLLANALEVKSECVCVPKVVERTGE